jgi:hypothetical protein
MSINKVTARNIAASLKCRSKVFVDRSPLFRIPLLTVPPPRDPLMAPHTYTTQREPYASRSATARAPFPLAADSCIALWVCQRCLQSL